MNPKLVNLKTELNKIIKKIKDEKNQYLVLVPLDQVQLF